MTIPLDTADDARRWLRRYAIWAEVWHRALTLACAGLPDDVRLDDQIPDDKLDALFEQVVAQLGLPLEELFAFSELSESAIGELCDRAFDLLGVTPEGRRFFNPDSGPLPELLHRPRKA